MDTGAAPADQNDPQHAAGSPGINKRLRKRGWRGYALSQLAQIESGLATRRAPHPGVHAARKAIRRLRSVLALGARLFGEAGAGIDLALRRLVRSLSRLRDAQVVVEVADRVRRRCKDPHQRELWMRLRQQLAERRQRLLQTALQADPDFARRRRVVARLVGKLEVLPWAQFDQDLVTDALQRNHRRMLKAERKAESGDLEDRHCWRRKARRLRMQLDAAHELGADHELDCNVDWLRQLVDRLGGAQDLVLLQRGLQRLPVSADRRAGLRSLCEQLRESVN